MTHKSLAARITGAKPARVAVLSTLTAALVSTLLGFAGAAPSASAADGNPTFHIGHDGRDQYFGFINHIRAIVDAGQDNRVPNSNLPVDHTQGGSAHAWNTADHFQVDIHANDNDPNHYVRLQVRRTDLYVVGWWSDDNRYNMVDASPSARFQDGRWREADGTRSAGFGENYTDLERAAGIARADIGYDQGALNGAVWTLLHARDQDGQYQQHARAFLMMTQFVSEATRFRPISDLMGGAANNWYTRLSPNLVGQENNWETLSRRFNELQARGGDPTDSSPLTGYWRNSTGEIRDLRLWNLNNYALVLNTAKRT